MARASLVTRLCLLVGLLGLAGCGDATRPETVLDPAEADNRVVFDQNAKLFSSLSSGDSGGGGGAKVPVAVSQTVRNLAQNLNTPRYALNDLLQGDLEAAVRNSFRFALNSTLGIGGVFDPAKDFGLAPSENDFGKTMFIWGLGPGRYMVVPILGPTTERELAGRVVDAVLNPLSPFLPANEQWYVRGIKLGDRVVDGLTYGDAISDVLTDSADPYLATRTIYLQNRRFELTGGTAEEDFFDPYEELYGN